MSANQYSIVSTEIKTFFGKTIQLVKPKSHTDKIIFNCSSGIEDKKQRRAKEGNRLIVRNECQLVALSAE